MADKSILDEFAEFLKAKTEAERDNPGDFAIDLSSTDKDGNRHEARGIPVSQASGWLYDKFGIGEPPKADDDGGKEGAPGAKSNPVKDLFPRAKRAAGS